MKKIFYILILLTLIVSCKKDPVISIPNIEQRKMPGGATTVNEFGTFAFDNPAPNLSAENLEIHLEGDAQFEVGFATSDNPVNPGLGPIFNSTSCVACHPNDGRAPLLENINSVINNGFFLRTSIPGKGEHGGPNPVPGFGVQLQENAVLGYKPEVQYTVTYQDISFYFSDGTKIILKKPIYGITDPYIPFPANAMISPRLAPPVFGLGLLQAITEEDILSKQDINDANGDGISGKANMVWDVEAKALRLGRFGWKANTPTVMHQSTGAYHNDMGVTNPLFPIESSYGQTNGEPNNDDDPEVSQEVIDQIDVYIRTLAVPAARNLDAPEVVRGYQIFNNAKCTFCHTPRYITGNVPDIPAISNQIIYPYTDLLLHDMGDNLADGRSDFLANGNEWKTRPLWGIGLTNIVNGHTHFLHDGRAKSIEEAILWHGGEAKESQEYYRNLSKSDREALVAFVNSL